MALPKVYQTVVDYVDTFLYNPSRRFLTDENYENAIRIAITQWALAVGGLWIKDETLVTIADQSIYQIEEAYKFIRKARLIRNLGAGSTEERTALDIIDETDRDIIDFVSPTTNPTESLDIGLTGNSADKPKYLLHRRETSEIQLLDPPLVAGDTIQLFVTSMPTTEFTAGVSWEGDAEDIPGIAFKVGRILRLKSRQHGESSDFEAMFLDHVDLVKKTRAKTRQVQQFRLGQAMLKRTRDLFGARRNAG